VRSDRATVADHQPAGESWLARRRADASGYAADEGAGVQLDAVSERDAFGDDGVLIQDTVGTDSRAGSHLCVCIHHAAVADRRALRDDRKRRDRTVDPKRAFDKRLRADPLGIVHLAERS
jgi:hypothetical protein